MPFPPVLATEIWSSYSIKRKECAHREFLVHGVLTGSAAVAQCSGFSIVEGASHPEDARLLIPHGGINAIRFGGVSVWKVSAEYGLDQSAGSGGLDVLDYPPVLNIIKQGQTDEVSRDIYSNPIVSSSRVPFASQPTKLYNSVLFTMARYESSYNISRTLAFSDKFNSQPVTVTGLGFLDKYQLLCKDIVLAQGYPTNAKYGFIIYTFEARDYYRGANGQPITDGNGLPMSGWARRILDQGRRGFWKDTDNSLRVGDIIELNGTNKGKSVTHDVLLDGAGYPKDTANYGVNTPKSTAGSKPLPKGVALESVADSADLVGGTFLYYEVNEEADFQGLVLPNG